ncbi:hypothetical protein CEXT_148161 [Caerostris extrusa]|uniref:Uncharacterized protein n=1 Tax=Caerostris extrusa TaxID=172846 RepID=A0AAV4NJ33_CAEEX|nr:hypothetical protein CEXT_148161 [Caerostris extrusa]
MEPKKRVNWGTFSKFIDLHVKDLSLDHDRSVDVFTRILLKYASTCIPRRLVKRYSPFWNSNLQDLKEKKKKKKLALERRLGIPARKKTV